MGCSVGVDPEIAKILLTLDEKIEDYQKTFVEDAKNAKDAIDKQLNERKDKLKNLKEKKEEITEEILKELNEKELEKELDILSNEVDKMHYIFDTGLTLVEPIRKITLNKLLEKAKSAPSIALASINKEIEEIKKIPIIEFLDATYGKVLKDALVKKGLSETLLGKVKEGLMDERKERRKMERKEFGIKVNEFKGEDITQLNLDLMSLIKSEYKEIGKNFKSYVKGKMVDILLKKD
jgi:hypothetical protein